MISDVTERQMKFEPEWTALALILYRFVILVGKESVIATPKIKLDTLPNSLLRYTWIWRGLSLSIVDLLNHKAVYIRVNLRSQPWREKSAAPFKVGDASLSSLSDLNAVKRH